MKVEKTLNLGLEKHDFYCLCSALMKELDFIVLSSYVQERGREKKYTVNVQCSVQYTLILLY